MAQIKHYQVLGKQTHDTWLVAAMIAHQITHLLSFNINDFKRFSEIKVVDPRNFQGRIRDIQEINYPVIVVIASSSVLYQWRAVSTAAQEKVGYLLFGSP